MAVLGSFVMQPADEWDFDVRYDKWLPASDTVSDQVMPTVAVTPAGLVVDTITRDFDNKKIKMWLSGGTDGERYKVEVTTRSKEGRVRQDEFYVTVRNF